MTTNLSPAITRAPALIILALLSFTLPSCKKAENKSGPLSTDEQKVSYGIGYNMAADVARQEAIKVDQDAFKAGIEDGLSGTSMKIDPAVLQTAFQAVQQKMMKVAAEAAAKHLAVGTEFLEKNKTRDGVKVTESGLQYEVLVSGAGPKAQKTSTVVVSYHGTLLDGTVFDSSVDRGDTAEFPVTGVIPGWTEALQLMSVGDKWKLFVPAKLAYGPAGRPKIPGNSTLIFEVELIEIK